MDKPPLNVQPPKDKQTALLEALSVKVAQALAQLQHVIDHSLDVGAYAEKTEGMVEKLVQFIKLELIPQLDVSQRDGLTQKLNELVQENEFHAYLRGLERKVILGWQPDDEIVPEVEMLHDEKDGDAEGWLMVDKNSPLHEEFNGMPFEGNDLGAILKDAEAKTLTARRRLQKKGAYPKDSLPG